MDDAHADSEFDWDPLIELIGEGGVIPIVGPDLITVESDGKAMPLYTWLAARLAARLKLDAPPEQLATLNQVAGGYLDRHGERDFERVYSNLKAVMPTDADLAVPEALANLARITPLKLFVSTTFDNLLERAINTERFGGQPGDPGHRVLATASVRSPVPVGGAEDADSLPVDGTGSPRWRTNTPSPRKTCSSFCTPCSPAAVPPTACSTS